MTLTNTVTSVGELRRRANEAREEAGTADMMAEVAEQELARAVEASDVVPKSEMLDWKRRYELDHDELARIAEAFEPVDDWYGGESSLAEQIRLAVEDLQGDRTMSLFALGRARELLAMEEQLRRPAATEAADGRP